MTASEKALGMGFVEKNLGYWITFPSCLVKVKDGNWSRGVEQAGVLFLVVWDGVGLLSDLRGA